MMLFFAKKKQSAWSKYKGACDLRNHVMLENNYFEENIIRDQRTL